MTLTLPAQNAVVSALSPDAAQARALLDHVTVRPPAAGLDVPRAAASMEVLVLGTRPNGFSSGSQVVSDPGAVERLLADLRAVGPVTVPSAGCPARRLPSSALVTVYETGGSSHVYSVDDDGCDTAPPPTGPANASRQLLTT